MKLAVLLLAALAPIQPKPSEAICEAARKAIQAAGSIEAAEQAARAQGIPEVFIEAAKRCPK